MQKVVGSSPIIRSDRRPRTRTFFVAFVVLGAAVSGCAGGSSKTYDAGAVKACLAKKNLAVGVDHDNTFAPTSRDLRIDLPVGDVLLAFAPTQDVADGVEKRVKSVAEAVGAPNGAKDVVRRNGNLVYWVNSQSFPPGLTKIIDGCL
jgi:hypothetical protein